MENAAHISSWIAPRFKWLFNYNFHNNGRIWLGWDPGIWNVTFLCASAQHITCQVSRLDGSDSCTVSMVYAFNTIEERCSLWSDLTQVQANLNNQFGSWCVMGDFNIFLSDIETNKGLPRRLGGITDFRNCITQLGITDLKFSGPVFTWWDCNISNPTMRKLDRVLVNDGWLQSFDASSATFLPRGHLIIIPQLLIWVRLARSFINLFKFFSI